MTNKYVSTKFRLLEVLDGLERVVMTRVTRNHTHGKILAERKNVYCWLTNVVFD